MVILDKSAAPNKLPHWAALGFMTRLVPAEGFISIAIGISLEITLKPVITLEENSG